MGEKKKPPTKAAKGKKGEWGRRLEVSFGAVSFGENKAGVQVSMSRSQFKGVSAADALLTKAQLAAVVHGDTPLFDGPMDAVIETGRLSMDRERFHVRLSFKQDTVERGELAALAKAEGVIRVERIGDAGENDEDEEDDDVPGQMTME